MGFENGNDSTGTIPTHLIGGVDADGKVRAIALVGDRLPVDVQSISVTIDNANLEISNDEGNPIPTTDTGTPVTGATIPTGGSGTIGWLSAIWKIVSDTYDTLHDRTPALGANTAANSQPVTLANDGIFAVFAGLANDAASITGSIHAKLRAIASTQYSNWARLQTASDLSQTFTYLDSGTSDSRINTVVYSSASLSLTITETYTYSGASGAYTISTIVRS